MSKDMLCCLTVGDVFDMATEKMNDYEEYPQKATQDDINALKR